MKFTRKTSLTLAALAFSSAPALAADWPEGYTKCAKAGAICKVGTTTHLVSFGAKEQWVVQALSGSVACSADNFGSDPLPGQAKKCAIGPVASAGIETAAVGWATQSGGTTGGAAAAASAVYEVSSASQLLAAIKAAGSTAKIIKVTGTIDMTAADNGGPFTSASDQAARNAIRPAANTTLIGVGTSALLVNARIYIKGVDNVIVRNLKIQAPCDIAPEWDPDDGDDGNWNAEYDAITIETATHVWIDHNTITDKPLTDDKLPIENGKVKQCHDGALDIKNAADYVTVSNNVFNSHDKNNLIGSSDSSTGDDGHLRVTFVGNRFSRITQRAPRVRFGQVHLFNNYHDGDRADAVYPHSYSIGVGYKAKVISQNNVFAITGASGCKDIATNPGSSSKTGAIVDSGSLLNGAALNLAGSCSFSSAVGWTVPYVYKLQAASDVAKAVQNNAGIGKISGF